MTYPIIQIRYTELNKRILELYNEIKSKNKVENQPTHSIIMDFPKSKEWMVWLKLWNEKYFLKGVELPEMHGLAELCRNKLTSEASDTIKKNAEFFNYVYNQCYSYIADNQNRLVGRANLKDLSHGKALAIILLAHLCLHGIKADTEELSLSYKKRIENFTKDLIKETPQLGESSSNDSTLISCGSTLNNILIYKDEIKTDNNEILEFYGNIKNTNTTLQNTLDSLDNYLLTLITGQNIEVGYLRQIRKNTNNSSQTLSNEKLSKDPLINAIFYAPEENLTKDDDDKKIESLFKGETYEIKIDENTSPFLLKEFKNNSKAIDNIKNLLKHRDKLRVLQNEVKKLVAFAGYDVNNFNPFLQVLEPYMHSIQKTKLDLHYCVEQFRQDTDEVYRNRKGEKQLTKERTSWEKLYRNKSAADNVFASIGTLSKQLYKALTAIPYNFFQAIKNKNIKAKQLFERSELLLNTNNEQIKESVNKKFQFAETDEIKRQSNLILLKQQGILKEYEHLIELVKEIDSFEAKQILIKLETRKNLQEKFIKELEQLPAEYDDEKSKSCANFEETKPEHKEIAEKSHNPEEDIKPTGFINKIYGWLSTPENAKKLQELAKKNQELENKNNLLEKDVLSKDKKINELIKNSEVLTNDKDKAIDVNLELIKNIPLALEFYSKAFNNGCVFSEPGVFKDDSIENLAGAEKIKVLLNNVIGILQAGKETVLAYKEKAGVHDKSLFWSHNTNGVRNACKNFSDWSNSFKEQITLKFKEYTGDDKKINANSLALLQADISTIILATMKNSIQKEVDSGYSSYKSHGFRQYLRCFYEDVKGKIDKKI